MTRSDPAPPHVMSAHWLPLIGGLLPLLATVVALALSQRLGLIPVCNPLLEGCVSISRAARHELPNYLFRALILPGAALQALTWWLAAAWLRHHGGGGASLRALPWVGLTGACFLVLYGSFLGTEGDVYRWLRRYGVVFYFGCTCIAMLLCAGQARRHVDRGGALALPGRLLAALALALPGMGLVSAFAPLAVSAEATRDAIENILEWWAGVIFTLYFLVLAWAWRRGRVSVALAHG